MPAKVKKTLKSRSARSPRVARSTRLTKAKTLKTSRSLSEVRQQSSTLKTKASLSRTSVVSQSGNRASLTASVYDLKGKSVGRVTLPSEIFNVPEKPGLIAQAVRVYLANQRLGTASTKTRGEVRGSTRKIYRQKGTGRARHGAIRAPIFVHGGVALGPRPHDFSMSLPQKAKRLALFSSLSSKLKNGEIKVIDLSKIAPKTKIMAKVLDALNLNGKVLLVTPGGMGEFKNLYLSARNINGVKIMTATTLNTYDVLNNKGVLFTRDSIEVLKKHFLNS